LHELLNDEIAYYEVTALQPLAADEPGQPRVALCPLDRERYTRIMHSSLAPKFAEIALPKREIVTLNPKLLRLPPEASRPQPTRK
jgi:hypothetical protein